MESSLDDGHVTQLVLVHRSPLDLNVILYAHLNGGMIMVMAIILIWPSAGG